MEQEMLPPQDLVVSVTPPEKGDNFVDKIYDSISEFRVGKFIQAPHETAAEYLAKFPDPNDAADSFIRWQCAKTGTSGFFLGLPGLVALPVTLPADLTALWYVQMRMAVVIAAIYGHDHKEDRVRTLVYASLLGAGASEVLREAGIKVGNKLVAKALEKVPGQLLLKINKAIGFRLLTKAGSKGVVNLVKIVPVAGGVVGGAMNATATAAVGKFAKRMFAPSAVDVEEIDLDAVQS